MLTDEQKANRKKGIGASEAGTVMGLNRYMSPYQLWMIKTGKMEPEDLSNVPQVHWGTILEEIIAQEYERKMSVELEIVPETLYHKDHPFILCHLDRKVKGQNKLLECKFAMFHSDEWGDSGSDVVPLTYMIQVQHQMAVTGYDEADLAVLIGGWDHRIYHFKRDEALIQRIVADLSSFWNCVTSNEAPELRDRSDVTLAYPRPSDSYIDADNNIVQLVDKIRELKVKAKMLEQERDTIENDLAFFIKDAEGVKFDNRVLLTWKANKNGSRVLRITEQK